MASTTAIHAAFDASLLETINGRRSVRSYVVTPISDEAIHRLLAAAVRAPTAMHAEPWAFVVVQDVDLLKRLSDRAKAELSAHTVEHGTDRGGHLPEVFRHPDFNIFYDAGTLIAICALRESVFVTADCWLAAENLMLAAHASGLGTCVIGSAVLALNTPEGKRELGIADAFDVIAPIIVGVPRTSGVPTTRKDPNVIAWRR